MSIDTPTVSHHQYLLEAYRQWMVAATGQCIITVTVNSTHPQALIQKAIDGVVALHIAPKAVAEFTYHPWGVTFYTRFNGVQTAVSLRYEDIRGVVGPYHVLHPLHVLPIVLPDGLVATVEVEPAQERKTPHAEDTASKASFLSVVK